MLSQLPFSGLETLVFLLLGAAAGFLGGLIGIGGGFVLVPGLYLMFSAHPEFKANAMTLTLGTTMACIIFTAAGSAFAQFKRGAVDVGVVTRLGPWAIPATILGTILATSVDASWVKYGFASFCMYSATRMMFFSKTMAKPGASVSATPAAPAGLFFGAMCGLLGVGGANLFVPFLMKRNIEARTAMGTASALQLPIATAGTVSYIIRGLGKDLPIGSLGYVYTPALFVVVVTCMIFAPLGVRATHALPVAQVKKLFAIFTALAGLKMLGWLPI